MSRFPPLMTFLRKLEELDMRMSHPDFYADQKRSAAVAREHLKLSQLIREYETYERLQKEIRETEDLLAEGGADPDMRALAEEELPSLRRQFAESEQTLLLAMVPPDPSDSRDTIMEIRAGAGGDEASLFAGALFRMYTRFADGQGWKTEVLSASQSDRNGFKEVIFTVRGEEVYRFLKFESGVHRVQRVPETEANGRIHTSTVTVAVLPEAEEVDVEINPAELEITVSRASGPGGQGVNTTDSAVQILHKPSGMIVTCAEERSQIKNRARALTVLRSRLLQQKEEEERAKYAANRRSQIGTGDRSERIRTYNFPQSRLTDHRIGLTLHSLSEIMEGDLLAVIEALQSEDLKARMELSGLATTQAQTSNP